MERRANIRRETKTKIEVEINLDGGKTEIDTGIGFRPC